MSTRISTMPREICCKALFCAAAILLALAPTRADEVSSYPEKVIRLTREGTGMYLETPLARYEDGQGRTVDLIGAVHIGDAFYYQYLNKHLASYDKLLFEMVGGEKLSEVFRLLHLFHTRTITPEQLQQLQQLARELTDPSQRSSYDRLRERMVSWVASKLQLQHQSACIDYGMPNFVFADMTSEAFAAAKAKRGQGELSFFLQTIFDANRPIRDQIRDLIDLWGETSVAEARRKIASTMEELTVEADNAIVGDRNVCCMGVLDEVLQDSSVRRVGIFYGCAHFPDMHVRLEQRGFILKQVEWVRAWQIHDSEPQAPMKSRDAKK